MKNKLLEINGWQIKRIQDISDVTGGSTPSTNEPSFWGGDIPFVTPTDITSLRNSNYIEKTRRYITEKGFNAISSDLLEPGTILLTSRATLGEAAINKVSLVTNQGFANIKPHSDINEIWLLHYLLAQKREFERLSSGSTFKEVSKKSIKHMKIPVPPLVEQRGIVEVLGTVDECIRLTDAVIERAEELKRGLMQQLLTRGIGHIEYKETPLGIIPKTWIICKIDALLNENKNALKTGPFGSSLKKESYVENGYKIYGQEQVIPDNFTIGDYYISKEKFYELKNYEIKQNDVLISLVGTYGKVSVVPSNIERGIINPRLLKITPKQSKINSHYLKLLLISEIIKKQLLKYSHGATMGIINTKIIKSLTFPIPSLDEQNKILEIITRINKKLACEEDSRDKLNILRKGLMQLLLSGKIRVELKGDELHRIGDSREANN